MCSTLCYPNNHYDMHPVFCSERCVLYLDKYGITCLFVGKYIVLIVVVHLRLNPLMLSDVNNTPAISSHHHLVYIVVLCSYKFCVIPRSCIL
jgi:hypothetical protein